ncbi:hypothetical protein B1813_22385 [Saccharomonospora piscinae]|uniref:Large ATP-binding protein n=2 Tax=Saccharomonospora piscinae TaxID=687388 RepID=A0A1V8ZXM0_SACPI|nr:hypothetical protein B1813_22385 [Saccharomonospora piscinae]
MWALTGRASNFQPDIEHWIEGVEVDWKVGSEGIRVQFQARDGRPTGSILDVHPGGYSHEIGTFDGPEQFEGVMGSVMMARMRLEQIPVWTNDREVRHTWPAYSSALAVRANALDPVVGNVTTIGVRMLQMFVGTDWAPAVAASTTALRGVLSRRAAVQQEASTVGEAVRGARASAQIQVDDLTAKLAALPEGTPDVQQMLGSATRVSELAREVYGLEQRLLSETEALDTIDAQLRAAKARQHTLLEDARLSKFFHRMKPTVCPRCASPVTEEQQAAEEDNHECSLCTKDLNLNVYEGEVHESDSQAEADGPNDGDEDGDEESSPVDSIDALESALAAAKQSIQNLRSQLEEKVAERDQAKTKDSHSAESLAAAAERRAVELELARARGALDALAQPTVSEQEDPADLKVAAVLKTANEVVSGWVKDGQMPLLGQISADIETLAVSFGADSLRDVRLRGNGQLDVAKGGQPATYSKLTAGEKLRVKIATAIALIKHGYVSGVGRHPGMLVLDSPAAEELPESDLATMVEALQAVAREADMQIFVATRNAGPLVELLPEENRRVAVDDAYVW